MPKKREILLGILDPKERKQEYDRLMSALKQALETALKFKLKEESRNIRNEIQALEGLNGSSMSSASEEAKSEEQ